MSVRWVKCRCHVTSRLQGPRLQVRSRPSTAWIRALPRPPTYCSPHANHERNLLCLKALLMYAWSTLNYTIDTHTHTHTRLTVLFPGLARWAGTRKVKKNLDLQQKVSGSCISWAILKSASCSRQTITPALHHCFLQAGCPSCSPTNSVKALCQVTP